MVIFAHVDTNIRDVVQDQVDGIHGVKYGESSVIVQENFGGGGHILNTSTGELWLGNIQCPERSVVKAIAGYYTFGDDRFNPQVAPRKKEFYLFPTFFELERLAREPIVMKGIMRLTSDGTRDFERNSSYFMEQKAQLDTFLTAYARAVEISLLQKPILQGFYECMKSKNIQSLQEAENHERTEIMKNAFRTDVYQEDDFISAFGRHLYQQLREDFGEPRFA